MEMTMIHTQVTAIISLNKPISIFGVWYLITGGLKQTNII
jgi:hypothetical protein